LLLFVEKLEPQMLFGGVALQDTVAGKVFSKEGIGRLCWKLFFNFHHSTAVWRVDSYLDRYHAEKDCYNPLLLT